MKVKIHSETSVAKIPGAIQAEISKLGQNPFFNGRFLQVLEQTGCVSPQAGWEVQHLWLSVDEEPVFFMPLYKKRHSWGEYVFDQFWADAFHRHGLRYYPKWVTCIPFTPSIGPRWWVRLDVDEQWCLQQVFQWLQERMAAGEGSSWHLLFNDRDIQGWPDLAVRKDVQFHWRDQGYSDFEGFLASFKSRKRKGIRRERQRVAEQGVSVQRKRGIDLTQEDWQHFYRCYCQTYHERGMAPYLSQSFFIQIGSHMAQQIVMMLACLGEEPVAAALCFFDNTTLYGRYWGALRKVDCLHFEMCFYQGIEFCLQQGLSRFDPGTQGEHKLLRGFEPVETRSWHYIAHAGFRQAIATFAEQEQSQIEGYQDRANRYLPFKSQ